MKQNNNITNELEVQFPKGDNSRGKALVLNAIAQLEINNIFKDIEQAIEECISEKPVKISESKFIRKLKDIKDKYLE